ncbi:MAG: hypothetical protein ACYCZF_12610 [Anaerolineae bacterium]
MDNELQFLVHFFNDKQYLFNTVTMAESTQLDEICDTIACHKGWYWGRFAKSQRQGYLQKRRFIEKALYEDYTRAYGSLKERNPIFFYLYPGITIQRIRELAQGRVRCDETKPHVLLLKIQDITDTINITFTLNDSHTAYWQRAMEAGITNLGDGSAPVSLPDHNRIFPFSMLVEIYHRYKTQHINYEIQVWDHQLLEQTPFTVLEADET